MDHVNFMFKSVSLQDMDLTNSGQPIFRVERLPNIRELYEQQQDEIIDVSPEKAVDYKVGDEVVVDLPTRTIEGKIGYVGETDVRIDTSAHGQSWDNEVLNKQQFEDGLRRMNLHLMRNWTSCLSLWRSMASGRPFRMLLPQTKP